MRVLRVGLTMFGLLLLLFNTALVLVRTDDSPSSLIAYQVWTDHGWLPYIMWSDGSHQQPLADFFDIKLADMQFSHIRWSPDGQWMAAVSSSYGNPTNIILIRLRDGAQFRLTERGYNLYPNWSPDGKTIYFANQQNVAGNIERVNIDGTGHTAVIASDTGDVFPSLSPDGEWIIYGAFGAGDEAIMRMRSDGTDVVPLADRDTFNVAGPWSQSSITWSPDGQMVILEAQGELYKLRPDGSELELLTGDFDYYITHVAWSPDGEWIAYSIQQEIRGEIYLMRADGSEHRRLTDRSKVSALTPSFSPHYNLPLNSERGISIGTLLLVLPIWFCLRSYMFENRPN